MVDIACFTPMALMFQCARYEGMPKPAGLFVGARIQELPESKFPLKSERDFARLLAIRDDRLEPGLAKIIIKNVGDSAAFDTLSGQGVIHASGSLPQFAAARVANHGVGYSPV